jgi:hypothetical protein
MSPLLVLGIVVVVALIATETFVVYPERPVVRQISRAARAREGMGRAVAW